MGLQKYIEQQLSPDKIDDSAVEAKLAGFTILQTPAPELMADYQEGQRNAQAIQKLVQERQQQAANMANGQQMEMAPEQRMQMQQQRARAARSRTWSVPWSTSAVRS